LIGAQPVHTFHQIKQLHRVHRYDRRLNFRQLDRKSMQIRTLRLQQHHMGNWGNLLLPLLVSLRVDIYRFEQSIEKFPPPPNLRVIMLKGKLKTSQNRHHPVHTTNTHDR